MPLSASEISIFLLALSVMLFAARSSGELFRLLKQPNVIGEIVAGILLGPTVLGALFPGIFNSLFINSPNIQTSLNGITTIAVVLLLLVSGLEVDLAIALKQGKAALLTSVMGIFVPFVIGFIVAYFFPAFFGVSNGNMRLVFALFTGTALSITALPVVARTLMDLNIFKTDIGFLIIASAMVNDLIGWIIFSVILGMMGSHENAFSFSETTGLIFFFLAFTLFIGRKAINKVLPFFQTKVSFPGGVLNFILIIGFLAAAFTEYIGVHAIFGAFIAGIAIGDSAHLKESTREIIQQFVTNIFAPLFFVSIGLRVNFIQNFDIGIVSVFLTLAFAGKVIGCGLGAYWGGFRKNDALAIGFGMNSRGAMEIVLGVLALQFGLINERIFVALVIMALATSISSAPLMNYFLKERKLRSFISLIKNKYVYYTNASQKKDVIVELINLVFKETGLQREDLVDEIWSREEILTTGISNYLAIPHAKIKIKNPVAAIAVSKQGIDFNSPDGLPSKVIILLLTPEDNNEIQLQILAEIANSFKEREAVEEMLDSKNTDEFLSKLKKRLNSMNVSTKAINFIDKQIKS
jgi:Kef-type K+ transport system membrane component KefB/mannitol/fructose-specific phosphotransferase system IIA component